MKANPSSLSQNAQLLLRKAYEGLHAERLIDYHVHIMGTDTQRWGNYVKEQFRHWSNPFHRILFLLFQHAFGVKNIQKAEEEALARLIELAQEAQGTYCLLAFDQRYEDTENTPFFVSNRFVSESARQHPTLFRPVASIHPYRKDALDELDRWADMGVRMIKWLPNVMGINPLDSRCIPYYRKMRERKLILLTHAGHESILPFVLDQELGNPLLMRSALDQGVRVIMAHSATLGASSDLDHPNRQRLKNFDLFLRLIETADYKDILFGDMSAVTQINRMGYLHRLLEETQQGGRLAGRLVNGSDYPIPCCTWAISTKALQVLGYLTSEERKGLNELFRWNPLLFDFVLKRTVRHPKTHLSLPKDIFVRNLFSTKLSQGEPSSP